jgi:ABC-type uncharacterized transport system substrate-binding protein
LRAAAAVGILIVSCLGLTIGQVHASQVVVLLSSELAPYNIVAAAVENGGRRDVKIITLTDDKRRSDIATHATWSEKPDVIVAVGVMALDIASREFTSTPVVFGMVADTYRYAGKPDMIAGIDLIPSPTQVLRAIHAVLPQVHEAAVVFDPQRSADEIDDFTRAGKRLGITIQPVRFSMDAGVEDELHSVAGSSGCLIVYPDAVLLSDGVFGDIVSHAFSLGLPTVAYSSAFARKGALMSVEADYASVGKDLSYMVGQILSGASPRAFGIHAPSRIKIAVNKAVADELGVSANVLPDALPADVVPPVELIADRPKPK